jgi:hypothetical protein
VAHRHLVVTGEQRLCVRECLVGVGEVVDRREGGADAIRAAGLPFVARYGREDFPGA